MCALEGSVPFQKRCWLSRLLTKLLFVTMLRFEVVMHCKMNFNALQDKL
jgi:hypothetical protein